VPGRDNAWLACGFSGHGMQQAPAVGWSLAAQVAGGAAPLIEALDPARIAAGRPLVERNVI
jgi:glycine/D-amino acid oxidase-like deaminating enzyme